jgi:polysaccharide pyruvyl transferase WcaK-like protein
MARFEFVVGMRLHFLIFAALRGVPFAPLPYGSKVSSLLEDLQMDTPPLGAFNVGQLIGRIDRKWDTRGEIRERIQRLLPALKQRADRTNELLCEILGREVSSNGSRLDTHTGTGDPIARAPPS